MSFLDLPISSFLEQDPRPTIVLDILTQEGPSVVYTNTAFELLRNKTEAEDGDQVYAKFLAWVTSMSTTVASSDIAWQGTWSSYTIRGQWRVASCSAKVQCAMDPSFVDGDSDNRSLDGSLTPSVQNVFGTNPRPLIDWTVHNTEDISGYVKWFKMFDWSKTALGPMSGWDIELRLLLNQIMDCPDPRVLLWGPKRITLYNEACIPLFGIKHPGALGYGPEISFAEAWPSMEPIVAAAEQGKTTKVENLSLSMYRNGFDEECFFNLIMQPICGADGRVKGAMDSFSECTSAFVANRRMATVVKIGESIAAVDSMADVWKRMLSDFSDNIEDVAFAMLYAMAIPDSRSDTKSSNAEASDYSQDHADTECILKGSIGAQLIRDVNVERFALFRQTELESPFAPAFREAWSTRKIVLMRASDGTLPTFLQAGVSGRAGGLPSSLAAVIPISSLSGPNLTGAIIVGLNPRRPFDGGHQLFIRLLTDRITHQIAAISLPKEQRLSQAASEEAALRYASMSRELLQRTQEAEQREAKFSRLYENAPVGMYLLRVDGSPIYLNEAYSKITGIDRPEELRYNTTLWRDQVLTEDVPIVEEAWLKAASDKTPFLIDYRLKRPWHALDDTTGTEMEGTTWLRASAFPDVDDNGNVVSIVGWVSDISLQKWSEKLQQNRLEEALEAKFQSERFIDTVSHEIRNPLSAILQSADGILSVLNKIEDLAPTSDAIWFRSSDIVEAIDSAQTIVFCTQHQKRIVDDILTFSKLDSNLIVLAPEPVAPSALLDRALSMFASELQSADITATTASVVDDELIVCDGSRVLQVLINLLTNAIKFTRDRKQRNIKLTFYASFQPPTTSLTGVHFVPRRKSRSSFQFGDEWGQGRVVYLQFAISDTGRGLTQVEMDHLFRRFAQASPKTYSQYGGSGLGLFISKELCELHGGQIGVSSVYDQGSTFSFYIKALQHDLVPSEDQVTRRSSLTERMASGHPINAMLPTADTVPGSDVTEQLIGDSTLPTSGFATSTLPPATSAHLEISDLAVLVVEDNLINQRVMAKQLRLAGCQVSVASDGEEALEFLRHSRFSTTQPVSPHALSVVLMDVEMPVMDGLAAARKIREMQLSGELNAHVPLAAVTANARSTQVSEALDAGMDIVVTKPFRIADIVPRIVALAEGHRSENHDPIYTFMDSKAAE